jgi:hypothetical protein
LLLAAFVTVNWNVPGGPSVAIPEGDQLLGGNRAFVLLRMVKRAPGTLVNEFAFERPMAMMTQANVQGTGIAALNDGLRDNIKGDAANRGAPDFIQGVTPPYGGMERFWLNIKGQSTGKGRGALPCLLPMKRSITIPRVMITACGTSCSSRRRAFPQ